MSQYLLLQEVQSRPAVDHGAADEEMLLSSQPEHSIGENHPPEEDGPDYERRDEEEQWVADPSPQARYLTRLRAQYGHSFRVRIVSGHPSCEVLLTVHQPIHLRQKGQRIEAEIHVTDKSDAAMKAPIHAVNDLGASVPTRIAMARQTRANTMPPKAR